MMDIIDKIRLVADGEFEIIAKLSVDEITKICRDLRGVRDSLDWVTQRLSESELSRTELIKQNAALAVENERLGDHLIDAGNECNALEDKIQKLEAVIKAAQEQEPYGYVCENNKTNLAEFSYIDTAPLPYEEAAWIHLFTRPVPAQSPDTVKMPMTAEEAVAMQMIGQAWLEQNAPERLKQSPQTRSSLPDNVTRVVDASTGQVKQSVPAVAAVSSGTSCCGCKIEKGRLFCSAQSSLDRCPSHEPVENRKLYQDVSHWYARLTSSDAVTDDGEHVGYCCTMKMMDEMEDILSVGLPEVMQAYGVQDSGVVDHD